MDYEIEKELVDQAIKNCRRIEYPVLVTGMDFADDMAHALSVINSLLDKVRWLEARINTSPNK